MDAEEWEWGIRKCYGKFLVSTSPGLSHFRGLGVFRGSSRGIGFQPVLFFMTLVR